MNFKSNARHLRSLTSLIFALASVIGLSTAQAATTAAEQLAAWTKSARVTVADFAPSASRGKSFFENNFGKSSDMPSCASCHTKDPLAQGKHVMTHKVISPLSPLANPERFTDAAKSEKWFKRNCNDVIARECTAAEKADFVEYLIKGQK